MRSRISLYRSERGAVFIQVGILLLALMALNVFIVDYGVMWTARTQAQAAADAAALAGATARAYDSRLVAENRIAEVAQQVADLNQIWRAAGGRDVRLDECPPGVSKCVKVNVTRTLGPSEQFFTPLLRITSYDVQATATAIVGPANTTTCLKPWALPDKWLENGTTPLGEDPTDTFHQWGGGSDVYVKPNGTQATSAANFSTDVGDRVKLGFTFGPAITNVATDITLQMTIPLTLTGGYDASMRSCNGQAIHIGDYIPIDLTQTAATALPVAQELYDNDGAAVWGPEGNNRTAYVANSCAPSCAPLSPRLWAVVLFDPLDFEQHRATAVWPPACGGNPCVLVSNIAGFFIDDWYLSSGPFARHGHYLRYPGIYDPSFVLPHDPSYSTIVEDGSWLVQPRLIR
jgi:hypothetical protein